MSAPEQQMIVLEEVFSAKLTRRRRSIEYRHLGAREFHWQSPACSACRHRLSILLVRTQMKSAVWH